jgi:hypothetical protein
MSPAKFFNFRALPLSVAARNRLGAIAESQIQHPHQRCELLKIILAAAYDPQRGLYVPLSAKAELPEYLTEDIENLPVAVSPLVGWRHTLFNNALMLRVSGSPMPSTRSTNAGFLVVTHEFDCKTKDQFEETLAWSTNSGPFADLDKELQKYRDYRGYCILFAGRRSIHFDFSLQHATFEKRAVRR